MKSRVFIAWDKVRDIVGDTATQALKEYWHYSSNPSLWGLAHLAVTSFLCPDNAELFGDGLQGQKIETFAELIDVLEWHSNPENIKEVLNS